MNCKQDRFHPPVTGNFHFETWMPTAAACVVCFFTTAGLLLKALSWGNKPDTVIVSPEDAPPFAQDFSWSFTVKLVPRKTFSNKGTGDQRGNNVFKAFKRQEMAGSHGSFFFHSLESSLDQHSLHHLSTPVFISQQSKGLLLRVAPPVCFDSCCKWRTTTMSRGGESPGAAYLSDTDCWPATSLPCTSILLSTSSRSKVVCLEGFPPFQ